MKALGNALKVHRNKLTRQGPDAQNENNFYDL